MKHLIELAEDRINHINHQRSLIIEQIDGLREVLNRLDTERQELLMEKRLLEVVGAKRELVYAADLSEMSKIEAIRTLRAKTLNLSDLKKMVETMGWFKQPQED